MPDAISTEERYLSNLNDWTFEALPREVIAHAKLALRDTLASAWAAQGASGMDIIGDMTRSDPSGIQLWGRPGRRAALEDAVFANAAMAAALDFDSLHEHASVHPDAVSVPAALGAVQAAGGTGKDYILAYAKGAETLCRLGLATRSRRGWFRTSLYGPFAVAVAVASALALDNAQTSNALGIAFSMAGGTHQSSREFRLTKRLQSAFATKNGVFSALLAQKGATGPARPWTGELGLFALYEEVDPDCLLADLGMKFTLLDTTYKRYPCCAASHGAIEIALDLRESDALLVGMIDTVEIRISPSSHLFVGRQFTPEPDVEIGAQFCIAHSFATALLRGQYSREDLLPNRALHKDLAAFLPSITVISDEDITSAAGAASVIVSLKDGRRLESTRTELPGTRHGNAGRAFRLLDKWEAGMTGAASGLSRDAFDRLGTAIDNLEELSELRSLT